MEKNNLSGLQQQAIQPTILSIEILAIWSQKMTAASGFPYTAVYCKYKFIDGNGTELIYRTAHFATAGKLILTKLAVGCQYKISTIMNAQNYDEWGSAEQIAENPLNSVPICSG